MVCPLVTIGIPTYNRAYRYLRQALESALSQDYENLEIIVSDNCSTDHTESLIKGYSDSRIKYFKQPKNIPASENFNFCLHQAAGAYFLLLHDDDMIDDDFVSTCMKAANYEINIGLIRTGVRIIDSDENIIIEKSNNAQGLSTTDFFLKFLSRENTMLLCGTLFNTEKLRVVGGFRSRHQLWLDVCAEFLLAARFGRLDIKDIKASFRKHSSQATVKVDISKWCDDSKYLLDLMCELVPEDEELIRKKGLPYFAAHNYDIASRLGSPRKRFKAYLVVYHSFRYRFLPPVARKKIARMPLYSYLRQIRNQFLGL
jgi:glycosyltransferase involved in cell wall biosynthesis